MRQVYLSRLVLIINFSAVEPIFPILKGILLVLKQRIAAVLAEDVLVGACV